VSNLGMFGIDSFSAVINPPQAAILAVGSLRPRPVVDEGGDIAATTRARAERERSGEETPPELSGGTFTVSNLGMYGVTSFTAVINPPQAAILAVGAMVPRAVPLDGQIVVRNVMPVTLACDHRILYGADAAQFLARIRTLLENPVALLL
ncbi:MAG: 2-oxo acid dehydrogenase subunit, partial [Solirubrobacterales bacterium]|nr:2-oxo acid dehydrogenase subunit [Solirubrobacterales bacterium]